MLIDARFLEPGTSFTCDLCVVGAGPAGIAIVERLRRSALSIVLLESGGLDPEIDTQRLYRGENTGRPYYRLDACRFRLFGGTSNRWGGWCRPFEPDDYKTRDWLPHSGWPIGAAQLEPYYAAAAELFELTGARFDLAAWAPRLPPALDLDGTNFANVPFQFSPETNFGERYRAGIATAPNVTAILHANVTAIELQGGTARVGRVQFAALNGPRGLVRPKAVVLAAGALENARLLLASRADRPAGLGNEHDQVGRYFMEHLHLPAGHLIVTPPADARFYRKANYGGAVLRGVIVPTADAQARHQLPAAAIALEPPSFGFGTPFIGWPPAVTFGPIRAYRSLRAGPLGPLVALAKRNAERAVGIPLRVRTLRAARRARRAAGPLQPGGRVQSLYVRSEQTPDPASRVELGSRRDALGIPEIRLDWRIRRADIDAVARWIALFAVDVRARGLGDLVAPPADWERSIIGGPHQMGTTRMSADPASGVVDADCRVHSVDNLYIAGASVFATGGYANPTFTLVALALRLADTLHARLRADTRGVATHE